MNLLRRLFKSTFLDKLTPLASTLANKKMVIPPMTQSGMLEMMPATLENTPSKINHTPHANPARLEAHFVIPITPLFWLKVVFGGDVIRLLKIELIASAVKPP